MEQQILESAHQYIVFKLSEQLYGIDIQNVQIIEKMKSIMRVPKVPAYIKGVMNLRGEIIPVVSLREQFELDSADSSEKTRIIIIKLDESIVGIIVDEVKEVVEIEESQVEAVQNIQGKMKISHILGVGKSGENIITLLNLNNIIEEAFDGEFAKR